MNYIKNIKKKILKNKQITFIIVIFILICLYYLYKYNYNRYDMKYINNCSLRYNRDRIYEFDNVLTSDECNLIIKLAKPHLVRSGVMIEEAYDSQRTSTNTFLKKDDNPLLKKIDDIVYSYLEIPKENYEDLQVVNYQETQKYNAHYDACNPDESICSKDLKRGGMRYATFIFYLNDDFEEGETEFPKHNFKAKPKTGKAVLFFNLNDDNTRQRENSFHGGLPPKNGEKWMCNKWIRLHEFK
jgi:prolyl 4-hydroxylase